LNGRPGGDEGGLGDAVEHPEAVERAEEVRHAPLPLRVLLNHVEIVLLHLNNKIYGTYSRDHQMMVQYRTSSPEKP